MRGRRDLAGPRRTGAFVTVIAAMLSLIGCGGGDGGTEPVIPPRPAGISLSAGDIGGTGWSDGMGNAARFVQPTGITLDSAGNLYVADTWPNTVRKVKPDGAVSTLAGAPLQFGYADGVGSQARLGKPVGIAADRNGNLYVADSVSNTIRKIRNDGTVVTHAGGAGVEGSADGPGSEARFWHPASLATDRDGNVYVEDVCNRSVRRITPAGVVSTLLATVGRVGQTCVTGPFAEKANRFDDVNRLAVDPDTNVYVAGSSGEILRITAAGELSVFAGGTQGTKIALATDGAGNVFVADKGDHTIRRISAGGGVATLAGRSGESGSADGAGATARFNSPAGLVVAPSGDIFVADGGATIRRITPQNVVSTIAGRAAQWGAIDASGEAARFSGPAAIAVGRDGRVYVADGLYTIRRILPDRTTNTLAGKASEAGWADGRGADARFFEIRGVAVDSTGRVYAAEVSSNIIRRITPDGQVTTFAGTVNSSGSTDGLGSAARFAGPWGVAVDRNDNLFVADSGNATIRRITSSGHVSTIAGRAGERGHIDGPSAVARFNGPHSPAVDATGAVFVLDGNTVRRIGVDGTVSTLAGAAGSGDGWVDGAGASARFASPSALAVDGKGNVYVADSGNHVIRRITPTGVVSTVAGLPGTRGVKVGSLLGGLSAPAGIAIGPQGSLFVTTANAVVEIVLPE